MQPAAREQTHIAEARLDSLSRELGTPRLGCVLAIVVLTTFIEAFFLVSSVPLWSLN